MGKSLTLGKQFQLTIPGTVDFKSNGIDFKRDINLSEWMYIGKALGHYEAARMWRIGDWVNYGEAKFGEKYAQALENTDYHYGSLRRAAMVCSKVAVEDRNDKVSFSHYVHITKVPKKNQKKLVAMVVKEGLTVEQLSETVSKFLGKELPPAKKTFGEWWSWYSLHPDSNRGKHSKDLELEAARNAWLAGQDNA